ncbi:MAG: hypothetical protein Kow0031_18120 [Anaerolineae bacterium]
MHHYRERALLENQIRLSTSQLGEVLMGSLRHAMQMNDSEMMENIIIDVGRMENFKEVQLINTNGTVIIDSNVDHIGQNNRTENAGCVECHQFAAKERPRAVRLQLAPELLRVAQPIANASECKECHATDNAHLGMLIADISLVDVEEHMWQDLQLELIISAITIVLVSLGIYFLIHQLVVRRLVAFDNTLLQFAGGNFAARLPLAPGPPDEIDRLAATFNQMAQKLERHSHELEARDKLRQQAIIEERERIARELHDGLAQVLGYVNTKAMAVRLWLRKENTPKAEENLQQLEEAARALFVDTREAILGLRMTGQDGASFSQVVEKYTTQFSRLSGIPAFFVHEPAVDDQSIPPVAELQLIRIIQEALTNTRKHAKASRVHVNLWMEGQTLEMAIIDDGAGFDLSKPAPNQRPHFGLTIMRERAQSIHARFHVITAPGAGTEISVQLDLSGS